MKIMKFGGTSVGKPERMHQVAKLITKDEEAKIVVLSALSGTTNALVEISNSLSQADRNTAKKQIAALEVHYANFCKQLLSKPDSLEKATLITNEHFEFLNIILKISFSEALNKDILAQGELLSTKLFSVYLDEQGIDHLLIPALDFMTIDNFDEPQIGSIKVKLAQILHRNKTKKIFITQGYISRNSKGEVDNLKRGGSDYSASLIAAAIKASVCEIWTDIDGLHNNDPRVVNKTVAIEQLSFEEAAELAYFGAKILHPASIWPAQQYNVPVKLLNTMQPDAKGTLIQEKAGSVGVKAVAAKGTRHCDGVPELCPLPAYDGAPEHGVLPGPGQAGPSKHRHQGGACRRDFGAGRLDGALPPPTLGWPAPARRHGARNRAGSPGVS
ncbi:MAG: aspartate kinase, partial [Aquabacterium sp.]|nr:aspartate kinase [Ferruginibacter sp.]